MITEEQGVALQNICIALQNTIQPIMNSSERQSPIQEAEKIFINEIMVKLRNRTELTVDELLNLSVYIAKYLA